VLKTKIQTIRIESLEPSDYSSIFSKFPSKIVTDVSDFTLILFDENGSRGQTYRLADFPQHNQRN